MPVIDNRTTNRNYQLPDATNFLQDDVLRLIAALNAIDVDVAGALASLAGKSNTGHAHVIADVTGLQAALDAKQNAGTAIALSSLSDTNVGAVVDGQFLRFVGTKWVPTYLDAAHITSGAFAEARIPSLDAAKIVSGVFGAARIPSLDASKIATGTLSADRIPKSTSGEIRTGTEDAKFTTPSGVKAAATGKFTIGIGSGGFRPEATNGAAPGLLTLAATGMGVDVLDFDTAVAEYASAVIPMPRSWNGGAVVVRPIWTASSGSGTVAWSVSMAAVSHDDVLDVSGGAWATINVGAMSLTAVGDLQSSGTGTGTPGNTPAKGDVLLVRVMRDVNNDTLSADARLIALVIEYSTDALTDD